MISKEPDWRHGLEASRMHNRFPATVMLCLLICGCAVQPDITGYPVSTPRTYTENKAYFTQTSPDGTLGTHASLKLQHLYEVEDDGSAASVEIQHNDPISVILQGVRLPEDVGPGTRDIAVILDIHTSNEKGLTTLLAFYQRDVPGGQMLNFNNLLVYSDPMWDSASPPYFRVRVLDVLAERNRRTEQIFDRVGNLSAQVGGMIPHPVVPIVSTAIDAAELILSNRQNKVLLDYQIQFYGREQRLAAGNATLGPLRAGQWLVVGRVRGGDSSFWEQELYLDRSTDRLYRWATEPAASEAKKMGTAKKINVPVPYVAVAIVRADAQVPKLVFDRSEALLRLLSTPGAKSDVDALDQMTENLVSSINAFTVERRLRRYRSAGDIERIIEALRRHQSSKEAGRPGLNTYELRRLLYVLESVTDERLATLEQWIAWGDGLNPDVLKEYRFVDDPDSRFGFVFRRSGGE